jgi:hypothetical protein
LTQQAEAILAVDLLHVDIAILRRIYALILVEPGTRRVHLVGISAHPSRAWTLQTARNLVMDLGDREETVKFLVRDPDSGLPPRSMLYSPVFEYCAHRRKHPEPTRSVSG